MFLGAAFAPVLIGAQVPGSFGLLRPSAPAAELTAVTAVLALLRTRVRRALPALSISTDCRYAVDVPQLKARTGTNHLLSKVARAEFAARARESFTELQHVRGHSGDPGNELADVIADLGCAGELSNGELLTWLGALRLPELAERPQLQLYSLILWGEVLAAEDPGLAPHVPPDRGAGAGGRGASA